MFALHVFIGYVSFSLAYENLALNKPSGQHYQYPNTEQHPASLTDASNAVDGLKSNLGIWGGQCVISANRKQTATWWVNLASIFSIHHITVYYRTGNTAWGPSNGFTPRFLGFSLYISNTTRKSDGTLCFHDTNFTLDTIPAVFNVTCPVHGQYVIYYNERRTTYPKIYSKYAFNELCEVEVYGCPSPGLYGPNCSIPCPDPNCRHCNSENGRCQGCKLGYEGHQCELECKEGTHGDDCIRVCGHCTRCHTGNGTCLDKCDEGYKGEFCRQRCDGWTYGSMCGERCGHCRNNETCLHTNGSCLSGCSPGFYGENCKTSCPYGYFGEHCSHKCSNTCTGCNNVNGLCESGCLPGWEGQYCEKQCDPGYYGKECNNTCGYCFQKKCLFSNGTCRNGCDAGFTGDLCKISCEDGKYGLGCNASCGQCLDPNNCSKDDGTCLNGCAPGYNGSLCKTPCRSGTYGTECHEMCGHCFEEQNCFHINGTCLNGCGPGYYGDLCKTDCKHGYYGPECKRECGSCLGNNTCNHLDGVCPNGCESGYQGDLCQTACDHGYYGIGCERECGHCLGKSTCNHSDGVCPNGCESGYQGDLCQTVCPSKTYGLGCSESCGHCRNRKACHNENGTCLFGCDPGFTGGLCKTHCEDNYFGLDCKETCNSTCKGCTKTTGLCENGCQRGWSGSYCHIAISAPLEKQDSTPSIIGGVVGSVVALLIIIIVVRAVRKKRGQTLKQIQNNESCQERGQDIAFEILNSSSDTSTITSDENEQIQELNIIQDEMISSDNQSSKSNQVCSPYGDESDIDAALQQIIPVDKLESAVNEKRIKGNYGFKKEYAALPSGEIHTCDVGKMPENIPKNRFRTTFPYDHSRVILNLTDTEQSDYINANYIDGVNRQNEYIATQGPKPNTIVDFWRMIWQQNVFVIVMLTNLKEGKKLKCSQYWPNKNLTRKYGSVLVKLIQEKEYAFFTERKFSANNTELNESREVTQYHYTAWPDHGTPEPMNLLDFHHHVMSSTNEKEVPTVVHCSAGVGRTGTFIALDALCQAGQRTGRINVSEFVKNMRDQRVSMVQTSEQYITIYYALNEFFKAPFRRCNIPEFSEKFKNTTKERPANQHPLSEEFQLLLRCRPTYSAADYKMARYSSKGDQTNMVLPLDKYSLHLFSFVKRRSTYINAITVPSFTNPRRFIVTQYPAPESAVDFLRLLNDHESDTVVCLDPVSKVESIRKWLPNLYSSNSVAPFSIYCQSTSSNDVISSVINIRMDEDESNSNTVSVIEPKCCIDPFGTPLDTSELRDLVINVLLSKTEAPVTVVSSNGASLCGVFIAVHNAFQQLEMDGGVDVFTIVRQLQVRRPELCGNIEEYDLIHRALYDHIQVTSEDLL